MNNFFNKIDEVSSSLIYAFTVFLVILCGFFISDLNVLNISNVFADEILSTNSNETVNITVPSDMKIIFNSDGSNTLPNNYTITNDSIYTINLDKVSLTGNNNWQLLNSNVEIKNLKKDSKKIKFYVDDTLIQPKNSSNEVVDESSNGESSIPLDEVKNKTINANSSSTINFNIERGIFSKDISTEKAFDMILNFNIKNSVILNNGDGTDSYEYSAVNSSELPTLSRDGYTFNGWYNVQSLNFSNPNSNYAWTKDSEGVWSSGNKGVNSSESKMISNEFTINNEGNITFEWRSNGENYYDYLGYDILNVDTGKYLSGESSPKYNKSLGNLEGKASRNFSTVTKELNAGTYQIVFMYGKDYTASSNEDMGFVKNIVVIGDKVSGTLTNKQMLIAKWTPNTYTITYNFTEGTGGVKSQTFKYNSDETFTKNVPKRNGYSLKWVVEDDSSKKYDPGDVIPTNSKNLTLVAEWKPLSITLVSGTEFYNIIPSTATSVVFTDEIAPNGVRLIDVSDAKDTGIVAWIDNTTYKVSTQRAGVKVNFNRYSSFMFYNCSNLTNIDFSNVDTNNVKDMVSMFYNCSNLTSLDVRNFDTSNVTDMGAMFSHCSNLTSLDVSNFDTSNVTDMSNMFDMSTTTGIYSNLTTLDVRNFNTSNVTNMSNMFNSCFNLTTLDVSNFDTSNVTNMRSMFDGCSTLTSLDVSNFDTRNVMDMGCMFFYCKKLTTLDASNFDTSNVTDMSNMFKDCSNLTTLDVSNFDTNNVTNMRFMFSCCEQITSLDVSNFNTSNVTDMMSMFDCCYNLMSLNVSNFDTNNVTDMSYMFNGCYNLTPLNVSNFNTSNVTNMKAMFSHCSNLTSLDISNFDTNNVTNMMSMFDECSTLQAIYVSDLWNISNVTSSDYMFNGCNSLVGQSGQKYDDSKTNVSMANYQTGYLKKSFPAILMEGPDFNNIIPSTATSVVFTDEIAPVGVELIDVSNAKNKGVVAWLDGTIFKISTQRTGVKVKFNDNSSGLFYWNKNLTNIDFSNVDTSDVTDMSYMFSDCSNLTSLDVSNFDTSNVTDMNYMFDGCSNLTSLDVSNFDTSNVTDMSYMFSDCSNLTSLDVSNFDTSNVTNMYCMFNYCSNLQAIYVSNLWNISNVTSSDYMFNGCNSLVGQSGQKYDDSKTDVSMANYQTGYLTYKAHN